MAKPSAVLSCVVVLLSIALIAIVVAGLVVFLDKYKDVNDLGIVSALALNGFFTPLLGVPVSCVFCRFLSFYYVVLCSDDKLFLGKGGVRLSPDSVLPVFVS